MKVCLKQYLRICPGFNTENLLPCNVIAVMNRTIQLLHKETHLFPFKATGVLVPLWDEEGGGERSFLLMLHLKGTVTETLFYL